MTISRTKARLVIQDYQKLGGKFKFSDRMTQEEAAGIYAAALRDPKIITELKNKTDPLHDHVRYEADVILHFMAEHPQAEGQPAAWPERAALDIEPVPENRFGAAHPEDALEILVWAKTKPFFVEALNDPSNPEHAEVSAQVGELLAVVGRPLPAGAEANGAEPIADLKAEIGAAMADPAYHDRSSVGHQAAVDLVERLHAKAYPRADQSAGTTDQSSPAVAPMARVAELQRGPAYLDKRHPDHEATIAAISAEYQRQYPATPEPVAAAPAAAPAFMAKDDPRLADFQARMAQAVRRTDLPPMSPLAKAEHLSRQPAYHNAADPGHAAAVHEVESAYAAAYPEPAPASDGGGE